MNTDIVIVGCGVAGLYAALHLPKDKTVTVITKRAAAESDSFLAQGGICVQRDDKDFAPFFEDTLRAGHYENDPDAVAVMIRHSRRVIDDLVALGTRFSCDENGFIYTKEGAHSRARILYHQDCTGEEITRALLTAAARRDNIRLLEHTTMVDLLTADNTCYGVVVRRPDGTLDTVRADYTVLATGGIGGLFPHSTNYRHLTGDALALALRHGVALKHIDYIQIHPTSLYTEKEGRKFLISESVRGEGAVLLNARGERFTDELQPRDVVSAAIYKEMEKEGSAHVWLSFAPIPEEQIHEHFPNICHRCLEEGYDITKEPIPVVPSQHYFMGGIDVDLHSRTSMARLYAVGETACNGVHGRNRLASNSLLESLVFSLRAAEDLTASYTAALSVTFAPPNPADFDGRDVQDAALVLEAIDREKTASARAAQKKTAPRRRDADTRRKEIVRALGSASTPLSGSALSDRFGVSRQIIVQDIAALKAAGFDILSTHTGYILQDTPLCERVFKVRHTSEQTADELSLIVSMGGTVADVFVWHKVYGKIEAKLHIATEDHVQQFLDGVRSGKSTELMTVTGGYHYHTVLAPSEAALDAIETALGDRGFLIPGP